MGLHGEFNECYNAFQGACCLVGLFVLNQVFFFSCTDEQSNEQIRSSLLFRPSGIRRNGVRLNGIWPNAPELFRSISRFPGVLESFVGEVLGGCSDSQISFMGLSGGVAKGFK